MAEGRILKKCISESKKLAELKSDSARLLYTWLIPHLDSVGRYMADPEIIKGHIVPKIKTMTIPKIKQILDELADAGLIYLYCADGEIYLQFIKFFEHQKYLEREAKSKIPAPDGNAEYRFRNTQTKSELLRVNQSKSDISGVIQTNSPELELEIELNRNRIKREDKYTIAQTREDSRSEPPSISFNFETQQWENIREEDKASWREAYPACNIDIELAKMREWLIANPSKGRKKNWRRFIVNWLSRTQERGGTKGFDPDKKRRIEAIKKMFGDE